MKSNESLLEIKENAVATFLVRHVSGLYVGSEAYPYHWLLHVLPSKALKFKTREEAETFINKRAVWLQEFLEIVEEKQSSKCTQYEDQEENFEHSDIKPFI